MNKDFWKKGDRILALTSGGVFLGFLLCQIPGAIIGGLLAFVYSLWSNKKINE